MEFVNIFLDVVKNNYANFNGRARRKEYWGFFLVNFVLGIILSIIFGILGSFLSVLAYIPYLVTLALLLPGIAVGVRRLHDLGKSGYFFFIVLIPLVGAIYLLYLFAQPGVEGANEYGEDSKK